MSSSFTSKLWAHLPLLLSAVALGLHFVGEGKLSKKKIIRTSSAPAAIGPYSQATLSPDGRTLYVSGCIGLKPSGGFSSLDAVGQARQALENLTAIVTEAGFTLSQVMKTTVLVADIAEYKAVNEVYEEFFKEGKPARAAFAVRDLPAGALFEVDCYCCR